MRWGGLQPKMTPGPVQSYTPHIFYDWVCIELMTALCSGAKHHSNHVGATYACVLCSRRVPMLVFFQSNRVSAIYAYIFATAAFLSSCSFIYQVFLVSALCAVFLRR